MGRVLCLTFPAPSLPHLLPTSQLLLIPEGLAGLPFLGREGVRAAPGESAFSPRPLPTDLLPSCGLSLHVRLRDYLINFCQPH